MTAVATSPRVVATAGATDRELGEIETLLKQTTPEVRRALIREVTEAAPPTQDTVEPRTAQWAAQMILSHLPGFVTTLRQGVEARLQSIAKSTGQSVDELLKSPLLTSMVRSHEAFSLIEEPERFGPDLGRSLAALRGRDAQFNEALETLGLSPLDLSRGVTTSLSTMVALASEALGKVGAPRRIDEVVRERAATLRKSADAVFGPEPANRKTRVMVTMPKSAATAPEWLQDLGNRGMNVARINTAHDGELVWKAIAENVRRVAPEAKILVDLSGPKVRTGPSESEPGTIKIDVPKDNMGVRLREQNGAPTGTFRFRIGGDPKAPLAENEVRFIPESDKLLGKLTAGARLMVKEETDRRRPIVLGSPIVVDGAVVGFEARVEKTAFFSEGAPLYLERNSGKVLQVGVVGAVPRYTEPIMVRDGDALILSGAKDVVGRQGGQGNPSLIGCTEPRVLDYVQVGQRVLIDDGQVTTVVRELRKDAAGKVTEVLLEVGDPLNPGRAEVARKILPEKGINCPDSKLDLPAPTDEDIALLPFVLEHADMIGFSFVQTSDDVRRLVTAMRAELSRRGLPPERVDKMMASKTIVPKVETRRALENLPEILVALKESGCKVCVMIPRGDLAVENGFDRLPYAQTWLAGVCKNAGVPYIYATEILETFAKKGVDSRAGIVDLDEGIRGLSSACIMLNKGPFIPEAVSRIVEYAEAHDPK